MAVKHNKFTSLCCHCFTTNYSITRVLSRTLEYRLEYSKKGTFGKLVQKFRKITLTWEEGECLLNIVGASSDQGTLIDSLFSKFHSKFQLWYHSILLVSFIYLIRTQLSQSTKLWCLRTSLIVFAYFENLTLLILYYLYLLFKPFNSRLEKCRYNE